MDYKQSAQQILACVGGAGNVSDVVHCATRLRFVLHDPALADQKKLQSLDAVKGIVSRNGQLQLIIGEGAVNKVYEQLEPMLPKSGAKKTSQPPQGKKRGNLLNLFLDTVSSIFAPIIPAIVGSGLLWGISYCLTAVNLVDPTSQVYIILNTFGNVAFYFMPIIIAFSAAKRFGCNPYVAAVLGGVLLHPTFVGLVAAGTPHLSFFGIPITLQGYGSTIIPSILIVWATSYLEKFLKKIIPNSLSLILTPTLCLIIGGVAGLAVLAPLGNFLGRFLSEGFVWLYDKTGVVGGAVYGFSHSLLVSTGMQVAFTPITTQNLATYGYDLIYPLAAAANAAQAAVCIYVYAKSKNKKTKSVAGSAGVSALIGVTEPAIFGVALRFKKMMLAACIGGALGSIVMSMFRVVYHGFGLVPLGTIVLAFGPTFIYYVIGISVAFVGALVAAHFLGFSDADDVLAGDENELQNTDEFEEEDLCAPVSGTLIPLADVSDKTFSKEILGRGIALHPTSGILMAPADGIVCNLFESNHAVSLRVTTGAEVLLHIGIDTIALKGEHFHPLVKTGDSVQKGDAIIEFNASAIEAAGYDTTVIMVVTNSTQYARIEPVDAQSIQAGEVLLRLFG